ncbi:LLM class flavin-dependent oxidoreductase [Nakamurella sp.]|uniref:LLM class flavin-dependent oxidoreductase n=1 Tax=Nakamurella sp. TaxID=1869182 RepID=UPI003B3BB490
MSPVLRVGVVILPQFSWPEARARWASLEERGFAHGWTYDHLSWRDLRDEPWFGTLPTLVAAATATTTLRRGPWVMSPNYRHPVTTAKDLMTIDDVSGGRLIAAIGAGGTGWDATVLGQAALTPPQRVARLDEFVTLTDRLLRHPDTTWRGDWFQAVEAKMIPAGSRDRIELVVAGNGPRTIGIAAARADGWATTGPESENVTTGEWWSRVAGLTRRLEDAAGRAGRDPGTLRRYLNLDSAPVLSVSSPAAFADAAGRAAELGFTDAVIHWPRPSGVYGGDDRVLDAIAGTLTGGAWTGR